MDAVLRRSRVGVVLITLVRYALAFGMFPYGWSKLVRMQFQVSAWNYAQPLGQTSGKVLLWATMGYSPKLQVVLGLFELVPSVLLLISRTRRIGALLMLPVAANVALLNFALDLWPGTKMISSVLLGLSVLLILYDFRIYLRFFAELLAPPMPVGNEKLRTAARVGAWLAPLAFAVFFVVAMLKPINAMQRNGEELLGERQINRAGTWKIDKLQVDGRDVPVAADQRLYLDFGGRAVFGSAASPSVGKYTNDETKHTIRIENVSFAGSAAPVEGTYATSGSQLQIHGMREGKPVVLQLERDDWGKM